MLTKSRKALTVIYFLGMAAFASAAETNPRLRMLKEEDQRPRSDASAPIDWSVVGTQDAERRLAVREMLGSGKIQTSEDFANAALIFQHGDTVSDIRLAYAMATIAASLDTSNKEAKWLTAAAFDRMLMRLGKPQWYGTQFVRPTIDGPWELYSVDESAVSDVERKELGVPPLAVAKARAATIR